MLPSLSFGLSKESNGAGPGEYEFLRGAYSHSDIQSLAQSVSTKSRSVRDRNGVRRGRVGNIGSGHPNGGTNGASVSAHLHEMTLKLLPLRHIEQLLIAKLVPPDEDEATHLSFLGQAPSGSGPQRLFAGIGGGGEVLDVEEEEKEVFVRPGRAWKGYHTLGRRSLGASMSREREAAHGKGKARDGGDEGVDEPMRVLNSCQRDIQNLWNDPVVREVLRRRKVRLEERPGL